MPQTGRENWRQVARATAAHSTVTFNDRSSCRFIESNPFRRMLRGTPMLEGPTDVPVEREVLDDIIVLRASHDGYAKRFGIMHERTVTVSKDGRRLDGEDLFFPSGGAQPTSTHDEFAVRFHLHPSIKANRLTDGHGVMLVTSNKEVWTFSAYEDRVELEESVYLAGTDGPRRTVQIVVYGRARDVPRVRWTFLHAPPPAAALVGRRTRGAEPELPL
jgi:uncharacterized heparinase superfamily protein